MSAITGPNYSTDNQISFIVQWFRTWSELQKDDFVEILAQRLAPGGNMNGLVNGMQKLDTGSKRVSLFSCQVKLFNEWWLTWADADKENLTSRLKESDPKFWATVQEELNGTRKKLEDDFFLTINTCATNDGTNGDDDECQLENNSTTITTTTPAASQVTVTVNGNGGGDVEESVEDVEQDSNNQVINQNGIENGENGDVEDEEMEADGPSG